MNALQIPELKHNNPGDQRRCVLGVLPHTSWKKIISRVLESFPEVQSVSFASVKPGALERGAFQPFHTMALYLGSYLQMARARELELVLTRLFQMEQGRVRFVFVRVPCVYGAGIGANLYPMTPLMERIRSAGSLLYRRSSPPLLSPLEEKVHQILLARSRAA